MSQPQRDPADASIGELVGQLGTQTSRLVRDEIKLVQAELELSVRHAVKGAGFGGAAGILALLGSVAALAAAVAGLALVLPVWAAALVVAAVLFAAAGIAAAASKKSVSQITPAVPETVESVKDDVRVLKEARHG